MIKTGTDSITALQLFMLMWLSRVIVTLIYMSPLSGNFNISDMLVQAVFSTVMILVSVFAVRILMGDSNQNGFLSRCTEVSKGFGKISAVLIFLTIMYLAFRTIMRFEIFTTSVIYPQSNLRFFLVILIIACLYCVVMGLDVLGRTAEIFFSAVVLSLVFILAATLARFEITNFTPFLYYGVERPLKSSFYSLGISIEVLYPLLLKDKIKGKKLMCVYPWIFITCGFMLLMILWQVGVLGEYLDTQIFPFFSLTSMTSIGFLERLDAVLTAAWVVCEFVRLSMHIYIGGLCLKTVFTRLRRNDSLMIFAVLLGLLTVIAHESSIVQKIISNVSSLAIMYAVTVIVLPLILLSAEKLSAGKLKSGEMAEKTEITGKESAKIEATY